MRRLERSCDGTLSDALAYERDVILHVRELQARLLDDRVHRPPDIPLEENPFTRMGVTRLLKFLQKHRQGRAFRAHLLLHLRAAEHAESRRRKSRWQSSLH